MIAAVASAFARCVRARRFLATDRILRDACPTQSACTKGGQRWQLGYQVGRSHSIDQTVLRTGRECSSALIPALSTRRRQSRDALPSRSSPTDPWNGQGTPPRLEPGDCISVQNSYTPGHLGSPAPAADLIGRRARQRHPRGEGDQRLARHSTHRSVAGEADENRRRGKKRSDSFRYRCVILNTTVDRRCARSVVGRRLDHLQTGASRR